jgi:MYXO-CTERM domain-containing protein
MSTNASASIISATPDLTVSLSPGPSMANFSAAGGAEFLQVSNAGNSTHRSGSASIGPRGLASIAHLHFAATTNAAVRYFAGQPVGVGPNFAAYSNARLARLFTDTGGDSLPSGAFGPGNSNGFLGFENAAGDLGWMQVQVSFDSGGFPTQLEVISWAYNDVAGAAIDAGQTSESSATPEPSTAALGLLALGAAGILALRKRRNQVSKVMPG